MDRQELDLLRKARQSCLEFAKDLDAVNEELAREPQYDAPKTKVVSFFLCFILSAVLLLVCALILVYNPDTPNNFLLWSLVPLAVWGVSLVTWPIRKAVKSVFYFLKVKFAKDVRRWKKRMNEKKEAMYQSGSQYLDDKEALAAAGILPPKYLADDYEPYGERPLVAITQYIEDMRADTIKEAINLYEADEREARRDSEAAAHRERLEGYAAEQTHTARRMANEHAQAQEETLKKLKDTIKKEAKRGRSAEEASARKSDEKLEAIKRKLNE